MIVFYWVMGVLLVATVLPSVFFFVLYMTSGEAGCQRRAVAFFRWAKLFGLLTFNIAIWRHVIMGLWSIFF